jgi:DNA helicase-2/ATP-dependent DNA helicase PcrA
MFAPETSWDDGLNEAQLEAASHGDGPLVVVAGAGTGKTRTLTARVAFLLERGVAPERILLLTFTRRAADDIVRRAEAIVGYRGTERPQGGTFHAVAHRHIAAHAEALDLPTGFGVLDPAAACDLMDLVRADHRLTGTATRLPRTETLLDIYSRCINNGQALSELVPVHYPWCEPHIERIADIFRDYTSRKRRSALVDFDDLLLGWRALLAHEHIGAHIAGRFRYVLVDEFQDLNAVQAEIVGRLTPGGRGLTVVGDEAQAIYGFRGSDPRHLRRIVDTYDDTTVIRLEENYRSRQAVLHAANAVRPEADGEIRLRGTRGLGERPTLTRCHDAPGEARAIVTRILEAHERGVRLRDQAVLVRAAHHSDLVEVELSVRKVPFRKYGGLRFLEASHVKDFVAAGRVLDNPHDTVAWYRILRLHRQIGPARARLVLAAVDPGAADALSSWPDLVAEAPARARGQLSTTLGALALARELRAPALRAEAVLEALRPLVAERYDNAPARLRDLERLTQATGAVEDFSAWLAELTLDPPASTGDLATEPHLDEDYVVISTVHSAKGLEWPIVHLPHLVDGAVPSDMALTSEEGLAEERRLFYVAVTRARDELHLYTPLRMPHHRRALDDRHSFAPASRFLEGPVLETLDVIEDVPARTAVAGTVRGGHVAIDLDPLWR